MKDFKIHWKAITLIVLLAIGAFFAFPWILDSRVTYKKGEEMINKIQEMVKTPAVPPLDKVLYDKKLVELANNPPEPVIVPKIDPVTGKEIPVTPKPPKIYPWPVKTGYPIDGALLPFNRIIAYYGNLYSTKMGVLGEYPEAEMFTRLQAELKKWNDADPTTPAIPALHYIAVVAQGSAGADGKYRARMPDKEIDKVLAMAAKIPARTAGGDALVFLDVQVGFSTIQAELPRLEKYLKLPNVHFGMDPEFSMKGDIRPGKVVGTYDATDVNFAAEYLAKIVRENNLPPKILVVHRYTQNMLTNTKLIKPLPEVQVVIHMDGWGGKAKKKNTYQQFVYKEPVQFTGFKLFYKNYLWDPDTTLYTPEELLKLTPRPSYIQYQ